MDEAADGEGEEDEGDVDAEVGDEEVGEEEVDGEEDAIAGVDGDEALLMMGVEDEEIDERNVPDGGEVIAVRDVVRIGCHTFY